MTCDKELVIERGITPPIQNVTPKYKRAQELLSRMAIGDSVLFPDVDLTDVVYSEAKHMGLRAVMRHEKNGIRMWLLRRIEA